MSTDLRRAMERESKRRYQTDMRVFDFEAGAEWMAGEVIRLEREKAAEWHGWAEKAALLDFADWLEGALKSKEPRGAQDA